MHIVSCDTAAVDAGESDLWECTSKLVRAVAGTIGHVAHGKSTVVKSMSGKSTIKFRKELLRNITIKLGYANAKVCYYSLASNQKAALNIRLPAVYLPICWLCTTHP